jgi:activator of HSP90 ATPase
MLSQREAVFKATIEVLKANGVSFTPGSTQVKSVLTDSLREKIISRVVQMFQNNEVELKATESNASKLNDARKLKAYVGGLCTNWFTKDKMLNGNVTYKPQNPGTGGTKTKSEKVASSSDDKIRELNKLKAHLAATNDANGVSQVNEAIKKRQEEIAASVKPKKSPVDLSKIPDEFKDLLE